MTRTSDIQSKVTNAIIAQLREGVIPWARPWDMTGATSHQNMHKRAYSGVNVWLLDFQAASNGWTDPRWGTLNQIRKLGGRVKDGEFDNYETIVFWSKVPRDRKNPDAGEFWLLKHYRVYNAEQCEGLDLPPLEVPTGEAPEPDEAAEKVIETYGARLAKGVTYRGDQAYYNPSTDALVVPPREKFHGQAGMYGTIFHEIAHATGHESRLGRLKKTRFGSTSYAAEELVAEITSAMVQTALGLEVQYENNAAYCASWMKVLGEDEALIMSAAGEAFKAARDILGEDQLY